MLASGLPLLLFSFSLKDEGKEVVVKSQSIPGQYWAAVLPSVMSWNSLSFSRELSLGQTRGNYLRPISISTYFSPPPTTITKSPSSRMDSFSCLTRWFLLTFSFIAQNFLIPNKLKTTGPFVSDVIEVGVCSSQIHLSVEFTSYGASSMSTHS